MEREIDPNLAPTSGSRLGDWAAAAWAAILRVGPDNVSIVSAGVAFFAMFALFPALGAIIAIWTLFADPFVVKDYLVQLAPILPQDALALIEAQVDALIIARDDRLGVATLVSLGVALWSARAGTGALMQGLSAIFREEARNSLRHYATALLLTLILVAAALVALVMVVVVPIVAGFLPLGPLGAWLVEAARWVIAVLALIAGTSLIYRYGPNRRGARMPWLTPGAILVVVFWMIVSVAFSIYIANFGRFNEIYGSIGAVIAMLLWLYLSAFLLLLGALFNVELDRRRRARKERTISAENA
jgi:membrane protein